MDEINNQISVKNVHRPDYISSLPDEIIVHILNNLSVNELNKIRGISKRINPVVLHVIKNKLRFLGRVDFNTVFNSPWASRYRDHARWADQMHTLIAGSNKHNPLRSLIIRAELVARFLRPFGDSMHLAMQKGGAKALEQMIWMGANPNATDKEGIPPLIHAIRKGDIESAKVLLRYGASPVARLDAYLPEGNTPMHIAAQRPDSNMISLLHENGASFSVCNESGHTPLHIAAGYGAEETVTFLINNGADLEARGNEGDTPIVNAVNYQKEKNLLLLLESGADPRISYTNNVSTSYTEGEEIQLIHRAAELGNVGIVQLLIEHGVDPRTETGNGLSPRLIAKLSEHDQLYDLLPRTNERQLKRKRQPVLDKPDGVGSIVAKKQKRD